MTIILRFFPNGEFSQGVDTSQRRDKRNHTKKHQIPTPLDQECRDGYLQWVDTGGNADIHLCVPGTQFGTKDGGVYTYLCEDTNGHHYAYEGKRYVLEDVLMNEPIGRMIARGELTPLVYQSVEFSPSPPPSRKKLESMTKNMARNIRQGVYLLEQMYSKDTLSFLTLTLPNLCAEDLGKCCERWDYLVDQILKWLRKRLAKFDIEFEYVYCTEIQSKRLHSRGEYAPHLHCVFRGRSGRKAPWAISPKQVRQAWKSIISGVVGHADFKSDSLENIQRIKYSATRYLSKYLSKGNCCLPQGVGDEYARNLRTQWGGMARSISQAIKRATTRVTGSHPIDNLASDILRRMDELVNNGIVQYWRQGCIVLSVCAFTGMERVLKVGSGCLSTPTYKGGLCKLIQYILGI